jgi:hypothetical protein
LRAALVASCLRGAARRGGPRRAGVVEGPVGQARLRDGSRGRPAKAREKRNGPLPLVDLRAVCLVRAILLLGCLAEGV